MSKKNKDKKPAGKNSSIVVNICRTTIASVRQAGHLKEFRIPAIRYPEVLAELSPTFSEQPTTAADVEIVKRQRDERELQKLLIKIATNVWQLRTRMLEPDGTTPKEAFRRMYRYVEAQWDDLAQAGIKIQDHTGMKFDEGLALRVSAYQQTPGCKHMRVHETLKPSVYLEGHLIQMGEVIVEKPMKDATEQPLSMPAAAVSNSTAIVGTGNGTAAASIPAETPAAVTTPISNGTPAAPAPVESSPETTPPTVQAPATTAAPSVGCPPAA